MKPVAGAESKGANQQQEASCICRVTLKTLKSLKPLN